MELNIIIKDDNGQWVELDAKDVEIVMTKEFANLEDPSSINASYTLDAKFPYTEHNNKIFGDLYRLDYLYNGVNTFNQKIRHECIVMHNQSTIYQGTMVLNNAIINADDVRNNYYNCTIYDEMYDVFKKIDYSISEPADSFDGVTDKNININSLNTILTPEMVVESFSTPTMGADIMSYTSGVCDYKLQKVLTSTDAVNSIGFLPTYKEQSANSEKTITTSTNGETLVSPQTGGSVNFTDLMVGLPANKYPEVALHTWKTYDCKPYIYYSAYLDFIFAEIYRTTGYKVRRDTAFFNGANPYWANLIRTCNYMDGGENDENKWKTVSTYNTSIVRHFTTEKRTESQGGSFTLQGTDKNTISYIDGTKLDVNKDYRIVFKSVLTPIFQMKPSTFSINNWVKVKLDQRNYCFTQFKVNAMNMNNVNLFPTLSESHYVAPDDTNENKDDTWLLYPKHKYYLKSVGHFADHSEPFVTVPASDWDCYWWDGGDTVPHYSNESDMVYSTNLTYREPNGLTCTATYSLNNTQVNSLISAGNSKLGIDFTAYFVKNNSWYYCSDALGILGMRWLVRSVELELQERTPITINYKNLLGDDFNILEAVTDFAKTFNLVCDIDYTSKEIRFNERGEYFTNYRDLNAGLVIDDWSNYINIKESLEHTTILSEYNNLKYTYEDRDTANNIQSRLVSDVNASTYIRDLEMPVNTEDKNYLEGMYNSYVGKVDTYNLYDYMYHRSMSRRPWAKEIPLYIDKSPNGEGLDNVSGQLLFRHADLIYKDEWTLDRAYPAQPLWIVDDTKWEIQHNEFVIPTATLWFTNYSYGKASDYAPSFSTLTYDSNYCSEWDKNIGGVKTDNSQGLYDVWHRKWNNIIYGINGTNQTNKKVTAYFHLPLDEYAAWNFSHLVRIDNNVYLVLSIDEYSFNNGVMKATLLQITNPHAIEQIDHEFAEDYIVALPLIRRLHSTTGGTTTYRVWSSAPVTCTPQQYQFPIWVSSATFTPTTTRITAQGDYVIDYTVNYSTNQHYPTTQDTNYYWCWFEHTGTQTGWASVACTNYPTGTDSQAPMSVTPQLQYVNNYDGYVADRWQFVVTSDWIVTQPTLDQNHIVVDTSGYTATITKQIGTLNKWTVIIEGKSTSGQAGEQQLITFNNQLGQTCTAKFERKPAQFRHEETIEGENGDTDIQRWDYKTVNDPLQSVYRFTLRANYDFDISKWGGQGTMYDGSIGEYCSDPTIKDVILRDMSDPNNPVDYDGETQHFIGQANNTYTLEWHYYRRQGINNTKYSGYFDIRCVGGHSVPAYKKQINVFCNNLNNNP